MDLRQLRYFVVLAEELHFRRAAERLNITQAPLSVALQKLERELGGQLFHRTQRRVELTELGILLRENALAILDRVDRSLADINNLVAGEAGRLRIAFTAATSLLSFFPSLIHTFRTRFPKVQVTLLDLSSVEQIHGLQTREIDIAIVRHQPTHPPADISFSKLARDGLVVAMHQGHPLADVVQLTIADLRNESFIFYPRQSGIGIYDHFIELCAKRSFSPIIVQEARDSSTIIGLAATGLGIAVVPSGLRYINIPNIVFKPLIDEDAVTDLLMACRAGEANPRVASFRQIAQASLAAWKRGHQDLTG